MSLQIWLPLNGNINNQGLNNTFTISTIGTVSYDTNGKLGNCFISGGTTQVTNGITLNNNLVNLLNNANGSSIAVWVKPVGTHYHYNGTFISSGNWNTKCWSFGVSQDNSKVDVLCKGYNAYVTCAVPVNEWTHLCCTFYNGVSQLYKNGEYIGQLTGRAAFDSDAANVTIGRETYANGYFGFNGRINDMRIYNHALSPQEIKEISQCLWVHYSLINRNGILLPSEYRQLEYLEGTGTQYINTGLVPQTSYEYRFKYAMTATDTYKGPFGCYNTESTNCTRIIQYNGSATTVLVFFNCKAGGGGQSRELTTAISDVVEGWLSQYGYNLTNLTRNTHYSLWNNIDCFPTKGSALNANMFLFGRSDYIGKSKIWYFSTYSNGTCVQKLIPAKRVSDNVLGMYDLVTGDFLTNSGTGTFVAGPEVVTTDVAADASGFQNNGIYVGNFVATPNTKRLNSALKFNGTNTTIKNINFNCENIFTVSIWAYSPSSSTKTWSFLAGCNNNGGDADIQLGMYYQQTSGSVQFSANGQYLIYQSSNALKDGWHLFTETFDGSTLTGYIDGISVGTKAITNAQLSRHNFLVGAKSSSTNASSIGALFDGWLADCRVYATALSANDVMNLYKQGV